MKEEQTKKEAFNKPPFFISYLITDPLEFGNTPEKLTKTLTATFQNHHIDMICFRDKSSSETKELALACLQVSKKFNIKKILINSDIKLCKELGFDGIHLNSLQFDKIKELRKSDIFTVVSCHTEDEIVMAKKNKSNAITYSPVFFKENKGDPKGIKNLSNIVQKYQDSDFSIIALGGIIDLEKVQAVEKTKVSGFASIRYFKI